MDYKAYIAEKIKVDGVDASQIRGMIAVPPTREMGDYALPCFPFAKVLRKSPAMIAEELAKTIAPDNVIESVTALSGYLNFRISRFGLTSAVLKDVAEKGETYGSSTEGDGKVICIDYSSINIAKPFHIGHLLTTVIGGALYRIFNFLGYKAVGINHLGDWGTQFGKLISAYKRWGDEEKIQNGRVRELMKIYVRFHEEAEKDPALEEEARGYFKKIEEGDEECLRLFHWFRDLTLLDVQKIYDLLNINFDSYAGESFYNDKMQPVIDRLQEKGLLKESEGAKVVDLEDHGMPPCLILKADGATLYATRDLAAAYYRKQTYDFYKCLYVVAYQQNLHFKQIFKVLDLLGENFAKDMEHVAFGMVSLASGAMSTRKGNVVFLEDVIETCIQKSRELMDERNRELENKEEVS
ncbi:MAG: arginine--tRNA ligase, partial [Clostridia bacterium]|nr:arginine--tRNA ligase [Clostridia bacterium]